MDNKTILSIANWLTILGCVIIVSIRSGLLGVCILLGFFIISIVVHELGHYLAAKHYHIYKSKLINIPRLLFGIKVEKYARMDEAIITLLAGPILTAVVMTVLLYSFGIHNLPAIILLCVATGSMDIFMVGLILYVMHDQHIGFDAPMTRYFKYVMHTPRLAKLFKSVGE